MCLWFDSLELHHVFGQPVLRRGLPISLEEVVQQQLEADGEFEDDPDSNNQSVAESISPDSESVTETQFQEGKSATVKPDERTYGNFIASLQYRRVNCYYKDNFMIWRFAGISFILSPDRQSATCTISSGKIIGATAQPFLLRRSGKDC